MSVCSSYNLGSSHAFIQFFSRLNALSFRMFYGPTVGGLITQQLNFKWAAAIQGSLAFLGVSKSCVHTIMNVRQKKNVCTLQGWQRKERSQLRPKDQEVLIRGQDQGQRQGSKVAGTTDSALDRKLLSTCGLLSKDVNES